MTSQAQRLDKIRVAYESGRARDAVLQSLPALAVVVAAALLLGGEVVRMMAALGVSLAVWLLLWRGQALGAGVFPGVAAGLVPLVTATVMGATGDCCATGGHSCSTACIVACSCAGAASGLGLAVVLRSRPASALAGAVVAVGVGMIGCAPLGYSSAFGMAAGALLALGAGSAATRLISAR